MECFQLLAEKRKRADNCTLNTGKNLKRKQGASSPMWIRESERFVHLNWIAILSYSASLAVSLAIWRGLFLALGRLVR
jgi:hypothetical protein